MGGSKGGILGFPRLGSSGHFSRTPVICEGPRRPGMTEPLAPAPPPRSGSKYSAEFPSRGRAPSSGSPGMGKRGQAAGWGRGAQGCPGAADASAQASAAGIWPATARPGGGPSEPGWGCILGPLAQRSRRLPETDSSHFGLTSQRSHKQNWPLTRASAQHPTPHLRAPSRHVTPTVQCHPTGAHVNSSHGPRPHTLSPLHTTHSTRWEGSPGKAAPLTQPPRTHAPPSTRQPPSCSCEAAAPFPCCANKRLLHSPSC